MSPAVPAIDWQPAEKIAIEWNFRFFRRILNKRIGTIRIVNKEIRILNPSLSLVPLSSQHNSGLETVRASKAPALDV